MIYLSVEHFRNSNGKAKALPEVGICSLCLRSRKKSIARAEWGKKKMADEVRKLMRVEDQII